MAKLSNFYYLTVFSVLYVQVIYCALDLSKEMPNLGHNLLQDGKSEFISAVNDALNSGNNYISPDWYNKEPKRGLEEFNDIPNEVLADEVFNMPLKSLSREQLQNSPWLQYVLIRKNSILYYLQEKRNPPMTPRLGRSSSSSQTSTSTDEQGNTQERSRPPFAPRLGKKSLEFSPRLGRSFFSE